jgi:AcrR family transcriptional regulator
MTAMANDAPSLTERRRAQTSSEIHEAAITLFERQGVEATTVAEIAEAAGVSSRTFFRYYDNKEHAGIPGQLSFLQRIERFVPVDGSPSSVLLQIEEMLEAEIRESVERNQISTRVALLFASEPGLLEEAAGQLQRASKLLQATILEHCPSLNRSMPLIITDLAMTSWHTSWEALGKRYRNGDKVTPLANYREHCAMLRDIVR